uniref:MICOS complex subunit MIC60 n=1 Tax=Ditylenchus dipsaci TaxID=166011 RepID=A0A915DQP0_9BILA
MLTPIKNLSSCLTNKIACPLTEVWPSRTLIGNKKPKMSTLSKLLLTSAVFGGVALGGMVLYGREDPRFRKRMVNEYPPTRYVFDFFLGPFGVTPYLIPAYEFKEGVKEKVNDVTETFKDKFVRYVPLPSFIKNKLQPPPAIEQVENVATDLAASGMLPNADPAFLLVKKRNPPGIYENDEYTSRLVKALSNAQNQVADVVKLKKHLIQDYQNQNLFFINMTSLASRNEETDARKAIMHLKKVISEGKNTPETSKNPYIRSAAQTAIYYTKQLDQLDYLEQVAKYESDLNSETESKLIWE